MKSENEDLVESAGDREGEGDRRPASEKDDRRLLEPVSSSGGPDALEGERDPSLVLLNRGRKLLKPEEVLIRRTRKGGRRRRRLQGRERISFDLGLTACPRQAA